LTIQNYGICSKFGKLTVEIFAFCNLEFGKKRSTVFVILHFQVSYDTSFNNIC
jgi:hypothetical protein